jgi:hypothetical protein
MYCKAAEQKVNTPTLFDLDGPEDDDGIPAV